MSNRWFRYYHDALDDPKVQKLTGDQFKAWVNLLCMASRSAGKIKLSEIPFALRLSQSVARSIVTALVSFGLFEALDEAFLKPHNWDGRQYKSDVTDPTNAKRQQRYRDRHKGVSNTVTTPLRKRLNNAPQNTDTEADTDSEAKASGADAPPSDPDRELFARGKAILGEDAGGLIAKLKRSKGGDIPAAMAVIEAADGRENPREYVGAAVRGPPAGSAQAIKAHRKEEWQEIQRSLGDAGDWNGTGKVGSETTVRLLPRGSGN